MEDNYIDSSYVWVFIIWKHSDQVMYVTLASLTIHLPESHSLKNKRRVVRSLIDRIRYRFGVSIAEVDGQSAWQTATIGVSCVSGSASQAEEIIKKVLAFVDRSSTDFEVVERKVETFSES